jgi:superfamily II DNA or RNA helicase
MDGSHVSRKSRLPRQAETGVPAESPVPPAPAAAIAAIADLSSDLMPPGLEPRPYQARVVRWVLDLFAGRAVDREGRPERAVTSVLVESPTGSGKTVMGLAVARQLQKREGMTVGWCAMRRTLLAQAAAENARGFGLDLKLISMFDKVPPQVDLLVVDEAQHDGALSMANLHSFVRPRLVLGLSATPFRADRFKLCFERSVKDAGIHHLIRDGYLSRYHHYTIPRYDPEAVADAYADEPGRWGKTLVFFHTLRECRWCHARLRERGVRAEVVTAATDRERQIADFAAGRLDVLVNMLLLAEGFDCPAIKTVFCRPSGKLCTIQMAGRALRRHPDLPFKQVVQCEQTRHPFPRTAVPDEQYLLAAKRDDADGGAAEGVDGRWRSLKLNARLDAMTRRMQALIAAAPPTALPAMLSRPTALSAAGRRWRRAALGQGAEAVADSGL